MKGTKRQHGGHKLKGQNPKTQLKIEIHVLSIRLIPDTSNWYSMIITTGYHSMKEIGYYPIPQKCHKNENTFPLYFSG